MFYYNMCIGSKAQGTMESTGEVFLGHWDGLASYPIKLSEVALRMRRSETVCYISIKVRKVLTTPSQSWEGSWQSDKKSICLAYGTWGDGCRKATKVELSYND